MSTTQDETDPYELLGAGINTESTEAEIRKAYRQRSLKVHPDRNPDLPDAARKFHELTQAYELLLDPLRRMAVDAKLRLKAARTERYAAYDNKRKNMVQELEEREKAFKKARVDKDKEELARWQENERVMDEGRRLREEREKAAFRKAQSTREKAAKEAEELDAPALGSLDTTIKLKYPLSSHSDLTTPSSLSQLLSQFGPVDVSSIVISQKPPKKFPHKPPKYATALVPFKQIGDAFAAVCASGRKERGLGDVDVGWAEGKEPQILGWLKRQGKLGGVDVPGSEVSVPPPPINNDSRSRDLEEGVKPQMRSSFDPSSPFSSFPSTFPDISQPSVAETPRASEVAGIDYESLTLMRMRQAERERLEREIREQEAND